MTYRAYPKNMVNLNRRQLPTVALLVLTVGCGTGSASGSGAHAAPGDGSSAAPDYSNAGPGGCVGAECQGASQGSASSAQATTTMRVPNVIGDAPDTAMQILRAAGLDMTNGNIGTYCTVSSQVPEAGSLVAPGVGVLVSTSCSAGDSTSSVGGGGSGGSTYTNGDGGSTYTNGDGG